MGRLHSAARSGRYEEVVECLEQREDINAVGIRQMTPLMSRAARTPGKTTRKKRCACFAYV